MQYIYIYMYLRKDNLFSRSPIRFGEIDFFFSPSRLACFQKTRHVFERPEGIYFHVPPAKPRVRPAVQIVCRVPYRQRPVRRGVQRDYFFIFITNQGVTNLTSASVSFVSFNRLRRNTRRPFFEKSYPHSRRLCTSNERMVFRIATPQRFSTPSLIHYI